MALSANVGIFRGILLPRLASFVNAHPDIRLQILTTDQRADFVQDGIDFAVRLGGLEDQDLIVHKIGAPFRVTVASPDYIRRNGFPRVPDDIRNHRVIDFLLPRTGQTLEWEFANQGEQTEIDFSAPIALNDAEARVRLAAEGLAIVQTVCFLAAPQIAEGKLVRLLGDWAMDAPMISILYPRNRYLPTRVRVAMDFAVDAIANALDPRVTSLRVCRPIRLSLDRLGQERSEQSKQIS